MPQLPVRYSQLTVRAIKFEAKFAGYRPKPVTLRSISILILDLHEKYAALERVHEYVSILRESVSLK